MTAPVTPQLLLSAYAAGVFPMAESSTSTEMHWVDPSRRGIFELENFHISRSLSQSIARCKYRIRVNHDFAATVAACADRQETWINDEIFTLYQALHTAGFAHSLEVWDGPDLVGGVYGVTLGGAFFGESMFSRRTDASKIALAWLVHRLRAGGFSLFDTQFITPHLASLGAIEISRNDYHRRLHAALQQSASFTPPDYAPTPQLVRQRKIHTS
ncbi:leucyl/phenylalanyl-tRNA--protein transferase [Pseudorhodobacter wandonensis]|uniref:leucyl/phenylalanyl-tRNA--protein transferase n=1 Tax=Pseudorhodobacter wandonensis TaxID=1120568 RepID=UPI00067AF568|nr:leucyl/phenylalanyl-tRNA--protein transferase [Pseudorhodobacter wandonensis]